MVCILSKTILLLIYSIHPLRPLPLFSSLQHYYLFLIGLHFCLFLPSLSLPRLPSCSLQSYSSIERLYHYRGSPQGLAVKQGRRGKEGGKTTEKGRKREEGGYKREGGERGVGEGLMTNGLANVLLIMVITSLQRLSNMYRLYA